MQEVTFKDGSSSLSLSLYSIPTLLPSSIFIFQLIPILRGAETSYLLISMWAELLDPSTRISVTLLSDWKIDSTFSQSISTKQVESCLILIWGSSRASSSTVSLLLKDPSINSRSNFLVPWDLRGYWTPVFRKYQPEKTELQIKGLWKFCTDFVYSLLLLLSTSQYECSSSLCSTFIPWTIQILFRRSLPTVWILSVCSSLELLRSRHDFYPEHLEDSQGGDPCKK